MPESHMASKNGHSGTSEPAATPSSSGRQRAPTITIDSTDDEEAPFPPSARTTVNPSRENSSMSGENPHLLSRDRGNTLSIPTIMMGASIGSRQYSSSSEGGDTSTIRPSVSASNASSWTSSRVTLSGCESTESLLPTDEDPSGAEHGVFAFSPEMLSDMFNPKSLSAFRALGGLPRLAKGLMTDCDAGLSRDETGISEATGYGTISRLSPAASSRSEPFAHRRAIFGENRLPEKKPKSLLHLMLIALHDNVLILLSVTSIISLALGLYQTFGQPHAPGEPRVEWVDGVTIMTAVAIAVVLGALNDYQKERQFARLMKKRDDRMVKAIRYGKSLEISVYDVLAGDVLHLAPGDIAPADGVLISSHDVRCDESAFTGETGQIKKIDGYEVMARLGEDALPDDDKLDPFIISGSTVLEGIGTYLVTCVGPHSSHGRLMVAMTEDTEPTPLQKKLGIVASQIATAGLSAAILLFVTLFIKFLIQIPSSHDSASEKGQTFLRIVIIAITVLVIAVPEGLPLAVTLALAIAVTRMLKDNNLVRILAACETMGNATVVCSDKTGTLTMNKMTVTAGILGTTYRFRLSSDETHRDRPSSGQAVPESVTFSIRDSISMLSAEFGKILSQSIVINSTTFESEANDGRPIFVGSMTEAALLSFAKERLGIGPVDVQRTNVTTVQIISFNSRRKCMVTVIRLSKDTHRLYIKGAPEVLLEKCTQVIMDATESPMAMPMTRDNRLVFTNAMDEYANHSLRTIGLAYRDFDCWPPPEARLLEGQSNEILFEDIKDLTFLGIFGIQDPLRPGVKKAVAKCQNAGVQVRMVTGDNIGTAKAIATECGILTEDGLVMEGVEFRRLSESQMNKVLPRLQVLARSNPEDKKMLVKRLKELGETVAVTGDGTNDGPALRLADVGFSMGLSGTEVAKEASSIILLDDDFSSIVKAIEWGRTVNDAIRKFLQFQLTVNITAVTLTFVSAIASDKEQSILTPVQLLWVNLIMDTFAALALATDPPNPEVLDRLPEPKSAPLVTLNMWKMMVGQSIYQLMVTLTLNFAGNEILKYKTPFEQESLETLVFNTYVWMQFFNQYNNRRLDNKLNVFQGLHHNWYFIGINLITISGQVLIIFFGGSALSATRLSGVQWAISLTLGAISLPIAVIIRLIPNDFIRRFLPTSVNRSLAPRIEDPNDDPTFDEMLGSLRASFRIRRNSRLGPLPVRFPKLRQILSAFRERG